MIDGAGSATGLRAAFDSPEAKGHYVRRLFATIADRYDLITVLLSFGMDRVWKRRAIDLAAPRAGLRVLDLASGTGDLAFAAAARGASVVGLDVTHRMLQLARQKAASVSAQVPGGKAETPVFVTGDMAALPFAVAQFDIVTTSYGLRNVPDLKVALAEIRRVLRPGGAFVSLDFNRPENAFVRGVYLAYLSMVGATLGWLLHRDPDTYRYIPASIRRYPGARGVTDLLRRAGFDDAHSIPVLGGLMAIHVSREGRSL